MPSFVPLSKSVHRYAGVLPAGHAFALEQAVVPVVAEELPQILPTMALAFVASQGVSGYDLVALQSLHPGVNVYVHTNGRWIGGYRPAWYRAHPFRILQDLQSGKDVMCVDEESEAFTSCADGNAQRLFDDEGELTDMTRRTLGFLQNLQKATELTKQVVRQLDEVGLIAPWPVKVATKDAPEGVEVEGLFHIDEAVLKALSGEVLAELASTGALSVAYTQLLSEHRLQALSRLYGLRQEAEKQNESARETDLEYLFGDDDDDDLSFNF